MDYSALVFGGTANDGFFGFDLSYFNASDRALDQALHYILWLPLGLGHFVQFLSSEVGYILNIFVSTPYPTFISVKKQAQSGTKGEAHSIASVMWLILAQASPNCLCRLWREFFWGDTFMET